ncbi:MAG: hypothetical protein WDW38_009841 [Sanguina aurantia]
MHSPGAPPAGHRPASVAGMWFASGLLPPPVVHGRRPVHPHPTGNTYERQAIEQWWKTGHRFCPRTGIPLPGWSLALSPNVNLRDAIRCWRLHHEHQLSTHPALATLTFLSNVASGASLLSVPHQRRHGSKPPLSSRTGPILSRRSGPGHMAEGTGFILRSADTDEHSRTPHTGVTLFKDPSQAIPAAALSNPDADQLERVLAYGKPVSVKLELECGITGTFTGANVIGEITGKKYPDQVVAIGGHLDSWDPGTGAIDDGAGVAIAMAAGKLIHDLPQRPDRTIRVIAFANEEMGLYGGIEYARKHATEVRKHQLGTESDFGSGPVWRMSASVKPSARGAIAQMAGVLAPLGVAYDDSRPGGGGSDLSQMHGKGMAALSLTQDARDGCCWGRGGCGQRS